MAGPDSDDGPAVNLIEPAGITSEPSSRLASTWAFALLLLPVVVLLWLGALVTVVCPFTASRFCPQLAATTAMKITATTTRAFRMTV